MGYDVAITKAWLELEEVSKEKKHKIRFLADEYDVDVENKRILSVSCNVAAKEFLSILLLHYLIRRLKGLPSVVGEWASFRQLDGGQGYYPSFRKRVIEPILRKYSSKPEALLEAAERFNAKKADFADVAIIVDIFKQVPFLIEIWKGDDELGPEVNVLFDKSIQDIFCTEDIVVLASFLASSI